MFRWGFPGTSGGKESTCNAGDPSSIPGLGRSPGEGIGYPLQYCWASLVTQTVKTACNSGNLGSISGLGRSPGGGHGNPLHKESPWTEEPGGLQSTGLEKVRHNRVTKHTAQSFKYQS